jgi:perosamine synthetase
LTATVAAGDDSTYTVALPLPKTPLLDWSSFAPARRPTQWQAGVSVEAIDHHVMTTSGRAALYQALLQVQARPGERVLVPTYHCPSMITPLLHAGLTPQFYAIGADGLPQLDSIAFEAESKPAAMVVAHYFGLPRSLRAVRAWCDEHAIVLIEDCAHCFFGEAGERGVGRWGDYAVASLTKFFPVPEAGLLLRADHALGRIELKRPSLRDEIKGAVDVLEIASRHGRLRGLGGALRALFAAKNRRWKRSATQGASAKTKPVAEPGLADCDMGRGGSAPLLVSRALFRLHGRARIYARRRENYRAYAATLVGVEGVRPLALDMPDGAAPYVFPLLVDDAERVYQALRREGMPVYRWDRVWPGTPRLDGDCASLWQRHLLQLLCHQDLRPGDIAGVCRAVIRLAVDRGTASPDAATT